MIDVNTIKVKDVLRDMRKTGEDESRAYYSVTRNDADRCLFEVEHCASGALSSLTYVTVQAVFVAVGRKVFCDIDLAPLLGRRLRVVTHLGTFTGPLGEIRHHHFDVDGETVRTVKEFVINGDAVPVHELVSFETL